MKLYKKLSCPDYQTINQQVLDFVMAQNLIENSQHFWNPINTLDFVRSVPEFQSWLATHNLQLHSLAVTMGFNTACCGIHIDTPPAVNKLSWPILNTKNTYNRWFTSKSSSVSIKINELGGQSYLNAHELEEIGRMEVVDPCIINAGIPHDVWFAEPAVFPRIGLQCMLFQEPTL
jgi:hypothetical protein